MKVALILHGHLRMIEQLMPCMKSNLLDKLQPDTFAFTWLDSMGNYLAPHYSTDNLTNPGYDYRQDPVDPKLLQSVTDMFRPRIFLREHYSKHDKTFQSMVDSFVTKGKHLPQDDAHHRPKGALSMVWSRSFIMNAWAYHARLNKLQYDAVIVTRWDVFYRQPIELEQLDLALVHAHGPRNHHPYDYFTVGNQHNMQLWAKQWQGMHKLIALDQFTTNVHQWQVNWFKYNDIPWTDFNSGCGIARLDNLFGV